MAKSIIAEGKTSTEAIEKGLRELKVSKDKVEIKILENEDKRSFFSILTPRVVKVELTLKEGVKEEQNIRETSEHVEKEKNLLLTPEEINKVKENIKNFLDQLLQKMPNINYEITSDEEYVSVVLNGEDAGKLIGYRGETLNAMQTILSSIANKGIDKKAHITLDIENYRQKRKVALEELADKLIGGE